MVAVAVAQHEIAAATMPCHTILFGSRCPTDSVWSERRCAGVALARGDRAVWSARAARPETRDVRSAGCFPKTRRRAPRALAEPTARAPAVPGVAGASVYHQCLKHRAQPVEVGCAAARWCREGTRENPRTGA